MTGACHNAAGRRLKRDKSVQNESAGIPLTMRISYDLIMLDIDKTMPTDPDELRQFTALLLSEVKSQAVLIEKLRHQLAGQRHHRFGSSSQSIGQLQLALETSEIAVAKMTAKLRLPDEDPKDKPKRRARPLFLNQWRTRSRPRPHPAYGSRANHR